MTSAFDLAGARLRENGISVLTIIPDDKIPGTFSPHGWRPESKWQRFCTRLPTPVEMGFWERWPDAGVGVALGPASAPPGMQLVAVDEDTDDPVIVAAIRSVVPPSPVRKRGRKGQTGFYLASLAVASRPYNDAQKQRILDLLCDGRQTVLPPSIHPQTHQPYFWLTLDTLESFDIADLPVLPDDIAERLGEALAPFGYMPEVLRATTGDATLDGDSIHRSLNEAALAHLDAWVPSLQLHGCWRTGDGRYKAVAHWRPSSSGRTLAKRATNLILSPEGIKDKGTDEGYTAIDLVMAACGADLDSAFRWLQERVAPQKPVVLNLTPAAPDPEPDIGIPISEADQPLTNVVPIRKNLAGLVTGAPPLRERPPEEPAYGHVLPEDLCTPAGLLGEVAEWINATAATPVPQHNLGAALALLGTLMGRRWESPTRARTNFYIMGLADSGFGKDHPMDAARSLAISCGLEKLIAAEETKSDSAIRKMLERYPVALLLMDEFGGFMKKVLDRRAAAHDKRMRDLMLTFFSRAKGDYMGSEGATERAVMIRNPHLSVYGASTPADMWKAFDSSSGEDGLLARFLVFQAGDERPSWVKPDLETTDVPHALRAHIIDLMNVKPGGNLNGVGNQPVKPIRAEWGVDAEAWWYSYREDNVDLSRRGGPRSSVYSRAAEHVIKLALVQAVGCDARQPVISVSSLEWARAVVETSMVALFAAMESRVADSDKQAEYLWVKRMIREGGAYGIAMTVLKKMVNGRFDKRRFDDIVGQLSDAGEIESYVGPGKGGGRPAARYRARGEEEVAA
jgi:hypothetical protein